MGFDFFGFGGSKDTSTSSESAGGNSATISADNAQEVVTLTASGKDNLLVSPNSTGQRIDAAAGATVNATDLGAVKMSFDFAQEALKNNSDLAAQSQSSSALASQAAYALANQARQSEGSSATQSFLQYGMYVGLAFAAAYAYVNG